MKRFILLVFILPQLVFSQDLSDFDLEAHYPFMTDGNEIENSYGEASMLFADFIDGSVYSNGIYNGGVADGTVIQTRNIAGLNPEKFAVQFEIKPEEMGGNILIAGHLWRWFKIVTSSEGNIELLISLEDEHKRISTTNPVMLNEWQKITLIFGRENSTLELYHNEVKILSEVLGSTFEHNENYNFSTSDGGSGINYKGFLKDLKIYTSKSTDVKNSNISATTLVFPNPAFGHFYLLNENSKACPYVLYDVTGRKVLEGICSEKRNRINISQISHGMYWLKMRTRDDEISILKVMISS